LTYSVEKLVFVAATTLPPNTHPIDNWYYAGTQAKQQPPGPDIIESCYPLGSSQSRAASRDEKFRPTPRWEFFNRIDPKSPVATDGYRASLGKHITGKSQMRWIRVVASPLHPNFKPLSATHKSKAFGPQFFR
jgi:hypothetical protein